VTRRLDWGDPNGPTPPAHPYRDSAILYAAMAVLILLVAWLTGGSVVRALVTAGIAFLLATTYSWSRWHRRLGQWKRRSR
jgi:hypothetical protein